LASCWRFCARQASGSCGLVQVLAPAGVSLARVWHECSTSCSRSWTKLSPTLSRCQLNTYESRSSVAVVLQTLLNVASVVHHQRCSAVSQRVIQRQPASHATPVSHATAGHVLDVEAQLLRRPVFGPASSPVNSLQSSRAV
jgi:hypothetical protein